MNRLILIGNGFDLAHGMETRYEDFILYYLKSCLQKAMERPDITYEDTMLKAIVLCEDKETLKNIDSLTDILKYKLIPKEFQRSNEVIPSLSLKDATKDFNFVIKSKFLDSLLNTFRYNKWVDFEFFYFNILKNNINNLDRIKSINSTFEELRIHLSNYIKSQQPKKLNPAFVKIFQSKLNQKSLHNSKTKYSSTFNALPKETIFLNFNYTSTIHQYLTKYLWGENFSEILIHGDAYNTSNPIILGYGDELNNEYKKILYGPSEGVKYFKNYWYAKTNNYSKLIEFIDSDFFEVFLIGHSCGSSDSVLLRTIVEHENCSLLHIHKYVKNHGESNFFNIHHNLSKLITFENQAILRKLILDESSSNIIPQISD